MPDEKRRRAAALQDAGAIFWNPRMREASWTAPVLWRFAAAESGGRNPKVIWTEMESKQAAEIESAIAEFEKLAARRLWLVVLQNMP